MSTLDEITKQKQRVREALARVDAQREKLTSQLSDLDATERVLARYNKGRRAANIASAKNSTLAMTGVPARSRGQRRATTTKPAGDRHNLPSLSDQVLGLATGRTQQEIAAGCKGARPNHVGAAISRHKRAGRMKEQDGKLYATQSTGKQ